jgi:hypothetical protein
LGSEKEDSMLFRLFTLALAVSITLPNAALAQQPITSAELEQAILNAAGTREKNLEQVRNFLGTDQVQSVLKTARIDPQRLDKAVSTLNAEELSRLASRTQAIQNDFAAGALTNQEITYILIALATAVLVLVIVAA